MKEWLMAGGGLMAIIFAGWLAVRMLDRNFGEDSDLFDDDEP